MTNLMTSFIDFQEFQKKLHYAWFKYRRSLDDPDPWPITDRDWVDAFEAGFEAGFESCLKQEKGK